MRYKLLPIIAIIALIGCKKNSVSPSASTSYCIVGEADTTNLEVHKLSPTLKIEAKETMCGTTEGHDSLDIDSDNKSDLWFSYHNFENWNCECIELGCGMSFSYYTKIHTDSTTQISVEEDGWVKTFDIGDTIDNYSLWNEYNTSTIYSTSDNGQTPPYEKQWGKEDKYVGFRKTNGNDTLYGWLLMNISETIEVKEFVIQK